jgi:aminopeptidase YwaD
MVGAAYPFPMFEDGDFDIPSVYLSDIDGEKLAKHSGEVISLESRATRIPSTGENVIARKGEGHADRVVFTAHIDARMGTPGASDNASGVVVLLLLAELLEDYSGGLGIEITAMNGEDYYSNPGEQLYIEQNKDRFGEILLAVNIDDVGYSKGRTAYSLYGVPEGLSAVIINGFSNQDELVEGEAWYAGDHSIFIQNQVPALALTSEKMSELMQNITHTPDDVPEILDRSKLVRISYVLRDLVYELAKDTAS